MLTPLRLTQTELYEVTAEAFRMMTGLTAPGKDSQQYFEAPLEVREKAWGKWLKRNTVINAFFIALETVVKREGVEDE